MVRLEEAILGGRKFEVDALSKNADPGGFVGGRKVGRAGFGGPRNGFLVLQDFELDAVGRSIFLVTEIETDAKDSGLVEEVLHGVLGAVVGLFSGIDGDVCVGGYRGGFLRCMHRI